MLTYKDVGNVIFDWTRKEFPQIDIEVSCVTHIVFQIRISYNKETWFLIETWENSDTILVFKYTSPYWSDNPIKLDLKRPNFFEVLRTLIFETKTTRYHST